MKSRSYYESTRRGQLNVRGSHAAQDSYTYNYLNLLPKNRKAQILDLGCSEGISLDWFVENGYLNVTGVDTDELAIKLAQENLEGKLGPDHILCMDAFSYLQTCEDSSLDMIVMFNVIEHISADVIVKMIPEIHRVLKSGGIFFAQTGNWENPFNIGLFTRDITHRVMYTNNSLRQLMLMSGFSAKNINLGTVKYRTTLRNFPLQVLAPLSGLLVKIFARSMRIIIHETSPLIYCVATK